MKEFSRMVSLKAGVNINLSQVHYMRVISRKAVSMEQARRQ